jgi:hypothetical protein
MNVTSDILKMLQVLCSAYSYLIKVHRVRIKELQNFKEFLCRKLVLTQETLILEEFSFHIVSGEEYYST